MFVWIKLPVSDVTLYQDEGADAKVLLVPGQHPHDDRSTPAAFSTASLADMDWPRPGRLLRESTRINKTER